MRTFDCAREEGNLGFLVFVVILDLELTCMPMLKHGGIRCHKLIKVNPLVLFEDDPYFQVLISVQRVVKVLVEPQGQ